MSVNLVPVDFAIKLVNSVLILPKGQVKFLGEFKVQENCNQCSSKMFFRLVEVTFDQYMLATACLNDNL